MDSIVNITTENPNDPICLELIRELSAELGKIYGDDGAGAFSPDDAMVPRSVFIVAWFHNEPVGCGALRPMKNETIAEIKRMFVRPSARGKGISRKILARLEDLGREFAYQKIWLETGTLQLEAVRLYETSGYSRIPCYGQYGQDNPLSLCYEKILRD